MERRMRYWERMRYRQRSRQARGLSFSWPVAIWQSIVPTRISVAYHVLRGRPTIYRIQFVSAIVSNTHNVMIADCDDRHVPPGGYGIQLGTTVGNKVNGNIVYE